MGEKEIPNHKLVSSNQIQEYIKFNAEKRNFDAKGPIQWDGAVTSAGLAKDIMAFANTRDGGVLVIGKSEPSPGKFLFEGLSESEANSFDTTKIATWVNNYCSPPVELTCYQEKYDQKLFVVIVVSEFCDIPILCVKDYLDKPNPVTGKTKLLLKKGNIYYRNANVESAPLETLEAFRELIGLATAKQSDQMLEKFSEMVKGRLLLPKKNPKEFYEKERKQIEEIEKPSFKELSQLGAWIFELYPSHYEEKSIENFSELNKVVNSNTVNIRQQYPPFMVQPQVFDWGIYNNYNFDSFALTYSRYFYSKRCFRENNSSYGSILFNPELYFEAGKWLDIGITSASVIEFFMFANRVAKTYQTGEKITISIACNGLNGRHLISTNINRFLTPRGPCRAPSFSKEIQLTVEEFSVNWKETCAFFLLDFYARFEGPTIELDSVILSIDNFEKRII